MKPIVRYLVIPMILLCVVVHFLLEDIRFFLGAVILTTMLVVLALIVGKGKSKRDLERGWRVGHVGRDAMYYEELRDGTWERIAIDGEMLVGKAHHVLYFGSLKLPEWARHRRDEIIARIKSEFHPPQYEYDGA